MPDIVLRSLAGSAYDPVLTGNKLYWRPLTPGHDWTESVWSNTDSGPAGTLAAPTSAINACFSSNDNSNCICSIAGANGLDIDFTAGTGWTGTLSGTQGLTAAGNITLNGAMGYTLANNLGMTGVGKTFKSNGCILSSSFVPFNSADVTLLDNLTFSGGGLAVVNNAKINTGGFTINGKVFTVSSTAVSNFTNSTINIVGLNTGTAISVTNTNSIWTGSVINVSGGAAGGTMTLSPGNGSSYNTINITAVGVLTFNNSPVFANFSYTSSGDKRDKFLIGTALGIAAGGSLTIAGNSVVNRAIFTSNTLGSQRTVTVGAGATVSLSNANFQDIAAAGAFGTWTGTSLGDMLGNSGITFDPSVTLTLTGTGTNNASTPSIWSGTTVRSPLPQDDIILPAMGSATTLTFDYPNAGRNINASAYDKTLSFAATFTINWFGNATWGASITYGASQAFGFYGRGLQTLTSNGRQWPSAINILAFGGTYQLQDNFNCSNGQFSLNNGTLDIQGFTLDCDTFTDQALTCALTGTGTINLNRTASTTNWWNVRSAFTINGSITIKITSAASGTQGFVGGDKTYYKLWWSSTISTGILNITGNNRFGTIVNDTSTARTVQLPAGGITTVDPGGFQLSGVAGKLFTLQSSTPGLAATLSIASGDVNVDYVRLTDITGTGGANFHVGVNSWNGSLIDADFVNNQYYGDTLANLLTCTRAQTVSSYAQTAAGALTSFAANAMRITDLGWLIEEARTNLCLQSQTLDNASWAFSGGTVTANSIAAPDGTTTVDTLTEDGGNTVHQISQTIAKAASSLTYTASKYFKTNGRHVMLLVREGGNSGNRAQVGVNLTTGAIASAAVAVGTFSAASAVVRTLANGVFRVELTFTTGTETSLSFRTYLDNGTFSAGGTSYQGDSSSGIYGWGAQLEQAAFATSYIPTTTASVLRNADVVTLATLLQNILSAYNASVYLQTNNMPAGANLLTAGADANNGVWLRNSSVSIARTRFNSTDLNSNFGSGTTATRQMVAMGLSASGRSIVVNNGTLATDSVIPVGSFTPYYLGQFGNGSGFVNGCIERLVIWNSRRSDATLQGYTVTAPTFGLPSATGDTGWSFGWAFLSGTSLATASPVLGTPAVVQNHAVTGTSLSTSAPTFGSPALLQRHEFSAAPGLATGPPTLGEPSINQNQGFTANALVTSSPELGEPQITQAQVLAADALVASSPVLGAPVLHETNALEADSVTIGSPVLGTVALVQNHLLASTGLATGSPEFGGSSIVQDHVLTAVSLETGSPVIGTPATYMLTKKIVVSLSFSRASTTVTRSSARATVEIVT